jgi:hypothetical protein
MLFQWVMRSNAEMPPSRSTARKHHLQISGLLPLVAVVGIGLLPTQANAVTFEYTNPLTGQPNPAGSAPWLKVVIEDVQSQVVKITVTNSTTPTTSDTAISGIVFNLDNAENLGQLTALCPALVPSSSATIACVPATDPGFITYKSNAVNLGVGGSSAEGFDLALNLPPPPSGSPTLTPGQILDFNLFLSSSTPTFNADSFNSKNSSGYTTLARTNGFSSAICASVDEQCTPSSSQRVPGPLPIAGAIAAFGASRVLRRRINSASISSSCS